MRKVSNIQKNDIVGKRKSVSTVVPVLRKIKIARRAFNSKQLKIAKRIKLLESFLKEARGTKITFGEWMKAKGIDPKKQFTNIGYYSPLDLSVSDDVENDYLQYPKLMTFNRVAGYYVPIRDLVKDDIHNRITSSSFGMEYNSEKDIYHPKEIYDSYTFTRAESKGDDIFDLSAGFTLSDIQNLKIDSDDEQELVEIVKEAFETEFDLADEENQNIQDVEMDIVVHEKYSNADAEPWKNSICRSTCGVKHPFNKSKREECQNECNDDYRPSGVQEGRREDREGRKEARKAARKARREARQRMREGEISRKEFRDRKKDIRQDKRSNIKEYGGSFVSRAWKGIAKVMPITLAGRAGALVLIGQNAFGFATRVAPALIPSNEAKQKFTDEAISGAKESWMKLSNAWENLGGNPDKLKDKIVKGYRKKPMKISRKSSFDGAYEEYSYSNSVSIEEYSNAEPASIATAITTGLATVLGLLQTIKKAKKDPYKSGQTPPEYVDAIKKGALSEPDPDSNSPQYDPTIDQWVDPKTGKPIDPNTGEYQDNILGMNKWLAIGLGVAVVSSVILLAVKAGKK